METCPSCVSLRQQIAALDTLLQAGGIDDLPFLTGMVQALIEDNARRHQQIVALRDEIAEYDTREWWMSRDVLKHFKAKLDALLAPATSAPVEQAWPTCANCGHANPHNDPAGGVSDACTHPACNCGFFVAASAPTMEEVCLGCGQPTAIRDCGCPAGTGMRLRSQAQPAPAPAEKELALIREAANDANLSDGAVREVARGLGEVTADDVAWAQSVMQPPAPAVASSQPPEAPQADEALGLSIDMLDVDRLRDWARNLLMHGPDVSNWGSVSFIVSKMQIMATGMEKAIRDIGTLRTAESAAYQRGVEAGQRSGPGVTLERVNALVAKWRACARGALTLVEGMTYRTFADDLEEALYLAQPEKDQ